MNGLPIQKFSALFRVYLLAMSGFIGPVAHELRNREIKLDMPLEISPRRLEVEDVGKLGVIQMQRDRDLRLSCTSGINV